MDSEDKRDSGEEIHLQVLEAAQYDSCKENGLQVSDATSEDSSIVAMESGLSVDAPT